MSNPCRHCGTESPTGAEFCCVGCEAVFFALNDAGLQTFYELQGERGVPVGETVDKVEWAPDVEVGDDGAACAMVGLDGVHCAGCVWLVERMPVMMEGVVDARLMLGRGRLEVRWDPDQTGFDEISAWLGRFGYSPYPLDASRGAVQEERERSALVKVGVSWALAANVMLVVVALYAGLDASDGGLWTAARWLAMILSGISLAYGGQEFVRRAIASFRPFRGISKLGVDVPVSLGLVVGWSYSAYNTVIGTGEVWFDSVAVLIAALLTARWLHARGLRIAADATNRLASVLPSTARRVTADGIVETIRADDLRAGELVEVRTGDVVPGDGRVEEGAADLDRALLTGESAPEHADVGSRVWAGEVGVGGSVRVRIDTVGDETRFGRLVRWVLDAEEHDARTVRLADRLAGWFVGAILLSAFVTGAVYANFAPDLVVPRVVALLVVSCPCALGMAVPLAFSVAVGRAARRGIFVRNDSALEMIGDVDTIVLDKTGTLTTGKMQVAGIEGDEQAVRLAAALERRSTHPIARAFAPWDRGGDVTSFDDRVGRGVSGVVDGHRVVVRPADRPEEGRTLVEVLVDGAVEATVSIADAARAEARNIIAGWEARGATVWVASGDGEGAVRQVAERVGIPPERTLWRQSPESKLELIRRLRTEGRTVAMVGDGVNDAAALREADLGVAMHGGAELNATAADVQLARGGLSPLAELEAVASGATRAVRRNLVLSAIYNVVALSAAMAGIVTPLGAAIAMPLSSVAVVASSLAQRFRHKPSWMPVRARNGRPALAERSS